MFTVIDSASKHLVDTFNLASITNWDSIAKAKTQVIIDDKPTIAYSRFPGFVTDDMYIANKYYEHIYHGIETCPTPPRGNISTDVKAMVVGLKPGSYFAYLSQAESSWLLGPSSEMLNRLMSSAGIYPYYSNAFHDRDVDENNSEPLQIIKEIKFLHALNEEILIIFLGKYQIYDIIIDRIREFNIKTLKIWQPAYLVRSYSEVKFNTWKHSLLKMINN